MWILSTYMNLASRQKREARLQQHQRRCKAYFLLAPAFFLAATFFSAARPAFSCSALLSSRPPLRPARDSSALDSFGLRAIVMTFPKRVPGAMNRRRREAGGPSTGRVPRSAGRVRKNYAQGSAGGQGFKVLSCLERHCWPSRRHRMKSESRQRQTSATRPRPPEPYPARTKFCPRTSWGFSIIEGRPAHEPVVDLNLDRLVSPETRAADPRTFGVQGRSKGDAIAGRLGVG